MLVPPIKALPKHILKKIYKKDFNKATMTRIINKYQLSILDELNPPAPFLSNILCLIECRYPIRVIFIRAPCPTQILKARCPRTCSLHTRLGKLLKGWNKRWIAISSFKKHAHTYDITKHILHTYTVYRIRILHGYYFTVNHWLSWWILEAIVIVIQWQKKIEHTMKSNHLKSNLVRWSNYSTGRLPSSSYGHTLWAQEA